MSQISESEKNALNEYATLKVEIRSHQKRLDELKPIVEDVLLRVDAVDNPVETKLGKFTLRIRRLWKYSEELTALDMQVKQAKKTEEATGVATYEEAKDVYFK